MNPPPILLFNDYSFFRDEKIKVQSLIMNKKNGVG